MTIYVLAYALNSAAGGYSRHYLVNPQRMNRWYHGLLVDPDAIMWEPHFGRWSGRRRDDLGYFFAPLIELDRLYWHPTYYRDESGFEDWFTKDYPTRKHPDERY